MPMNEDDPTRLRFGLHKDKSLCDVPQEYLEWLARQPWLWVHVRFDVETELATRRAAVSKSARERHVEPRTKRQPDFLEMAWTRGRTGRA